ncbi:MAG: LLM class flavin-dependent oxidoreductase [Deltaproteobacteria bacterium]|jgi:probable F420-dependent oxidoreductase|nr:LLM class flavin-dependent oxidoreductase [Deltaproteobacteria bacterium]
MDYDGLAVVDQVKMGLMLPAGDRASVLSRAHQIEASGLDSIWVGDHIAFHIPVIESLSLLSFLAAATERVELASGVLLLPLRHPNLIAKMTSTIDMLSAGRLLLGIGVGGEFPPEFAAVDSPIEERGPRTNETIEILRRHWSEQSVEYHGRHFDFGPVNIEPKPFREGGPPIIVGGRKAVSMKRAGRLGDGYISHMCDVETYRSNLASIARHAKEAGRAGLPFQTAALLFTVLDDSYEAAHERASQLLGTIYNTDFREASKRYCLLGKPEDCLDQMRRFARAGCRHFVLSALSDPDEIIERASSEMVSELRSLV